MNGNETNTGMHHPWWNKGLVLLLRVIFRLIGSFALVGFLCVVLLEGWGFRHQRHDSRKPDDFVYILNHAGLGKVTHIERVVHSEKRGASQFVELEVVPFPEESLQPSKFDKMTDAGWMRFPALDPSIASMVRQIQARARAEKFDWFPDMNAISSDPMRLNLWSGSLKHGELNMGYLILCDPEHRRIFAADIKAP
jgi:hypothetical protein